MSLQINKIETFITIHTFVCYWKYTDTHKKTATTSISTSRHWFGYWLDVQNKNHMGLDMLGAPIFFSNLLSESESQCYFKWHSDTERSNALRISIWNQCVLSFFFFFFKISEFYDKVILSHFPILIKVLQKLKQTVCLRDFTVKKNAFSEVISSIDGTPQQGHLAETDTLHFCPRRILFHTRQSRRPLALQLRPSCAWCSEIWLRDISINTNVTFYLGVGEMHMQGITRNNVKITFKSPRRLSNSTLRFSFSKIMLSPPGCLISCLNSCLKHEIYETFESIWLISSC